MARENQHRLFLGIDCGTHSLRVGCYDRHGLPYAQTSRQFITHFPPASGAEQDAEVWWQALTDCCQEICRDRRLADSIGAVGLCGTSSTLVPCDESLTPTAPAILWMDNRAETEASELRAILGWREVSSEHLAPRLLWLARNQPDALVHPLVECVSWLTARLTGNLIVSSSIRHFLWGLEPSQVTLLLTRFPEISAGLKCLDLSVQAPHASSGFLTPASARALGITAPDVVVAAGGNDAMMCAAGAGLWNDATSVVEVGGTSYVTVSRSCSRRAVGSFLSGPDPFSRCGKLYLTSLETAGLFLDWLGSVLRVTPEEMDQIMTRAGGQVACGCQPAQGIKVGMALMRDKHGRGGGGFLRGLRPTTTRESLLLSAVEEVARQAHQRLAQLAVRSRPAIQRLILTGGFSTNAAFVQLRARQAMRLSPAIKTFTTQGGNVGCRGAAMCAACANDTFADMSAASAAMACSLDPVGVDTP